MMMTIAIVAINTELLMSFIGAFTGVLLGVMLARIIINYKENDIKKK